MNVAKRFLIGASVALAATLGSTMAGAQSYPNKLITVIIPFAGGSASDVVSRVLFNKMSALLGQPIVVENKPGAGGNLDTAVAAKAAPDGYTLVGAASGPLAANLTLYKELGYDPHNVLEAGIVMHWSNPAEWTSLRQREGRVAFVEQIRKDIESIPGVLSAAVAIEVGDAAVGQGVP